MSLLRMVRSSLVAASVVCVVLLAGTAGCTDTPTAPSHYAPYSQTDILAGTGADAATGFQVTVNYTGWLYDADKPQQKGAQFDSSIGGTPFQFTIGVGQVIDGWDRGVPGMKVGGKRRLVIPPSLAYGQTRNSSIPPNATLVFEIELVSVP